MSQPPPSPGPTPPPETPDSGPPIPPPPPGPYAEQQQPPPTPYSPPPYIGGYQPPTYMGPSGPYVPPAPGGRSTRRGWIIGVVIGAIVLLLCCGCLGGLIFFGVRALESTEKEARQVVSSYLGELRDEEYADAYDLLCEDLQEKETEQEFVQRLEQEATERKLTDYTIEDSSIDSGTDTGFTVKAELTYTVIATGKEEEDSESFDVVINDNGDFRVCS